MTDSNSRGRKLGGANAKQFDVYAVSSKGVEPERICSVEARSADEAKKKGERFALALGRSFSYVRVSD